MTKDFENGAVDAICRKFLVAGEYRGFEKVSFGHINLTLKVYYFRNGEIKPYILQRINTYVFKRPEEIMYNVVGVTEYIRKKIKEIYTTAKRDVLHYQHTENGDYFYYDEEGGFWRCYRFIDDSEAINYTDDLNMIKEMGKAFGDFQNYLADYPAEKLFIVIPHFHNTVNRYENFRKAVEADEVKRAEGVKSEIDDYFSLEDVATKMYKMQVAGELPLRVTHNDTKSNNVLFDIKTHAHLAVIDLDTVMPGLVGFDFGDAIRFTANTAAEDEKDLTKVRLDLDKFRAFTEGFVGSVGKSLTEAEKDTLALGAITMTVECGTRFLTDHLEGDKYFGVHYEGQNLDRARCQLALAKDMVKHYDEMKEIVKEYL